MKIVATIYDDKFLCEVSADELAQLHGLRNAEDFDYRKINVNIGTEIDLQKAIDVLDNVRTLDQSKLGHIIRQLKIVLHQVDDAKTTAEALNLFHNLSKDNP